MRIGSRLLPDTVSVQMTDGTRTVPHLRVATTLRVLRSLKASANMAEERVQRRLAAILAADVVGYSRLMEADEAGTLAALKARRARC